MADFLLDTHALIYWLIGSPKMPLVVRSLIELDDSDIFVSAASIYEIGYKHRLGKLGEMDNVIGDLFPTLARQGFLLLPITAHHAARAAAFAADHRDPFDRLLAAQSIGDNLPIFSADIALDAFGVERHWA